MAQERREMFLLKCFEKKTDFSFTRVPSLNEFIGYEKFGLKIPKTSTKNTV